MPSYYLVQEQDDGCDYTIGCGIRIDLLQAKTIEGAMKEILGDLDHEGVLITHEEGADHARILEVTGVKEIDVKKIRCVIERKKELERKEKEEKEELALLAKLKKKHEGK